VQHAVASLHKRGYHAAVVDYRGIDQSLTSPRTFGADSSADFPEIVAAVSARIPPGSDLFAVGHSMGGACLAKYLGDAAGPSCRVRAAATLSSPLALASHMRRLESSPSWRAANFLTASIARLTLLRKWLTDPPSRPHLRAVDWAGVFACMSLRDLERATICPMNGYADPEDYYAHSQPDLQRLGVPLLVIHARDDPVIGVSELPWAELRAHPKIQVVLTPTGGHLGYYASDEAAQRVDALVGDFFEKHRSRAVPGRSRL